MNGPCLDTLTVVCALVGFLTIACATGFIVAEVLWRVYKWLLALREAKP